MTADIFDDDLYDLHHFMLYGNINLIDLHYMLSQFLSYFWQYEY